MTLDSCPMQGRCGLLNAVSRRSQHPILGTAGVDNNSSINSDQQPSPNVAIRLSETRPANIALFASILQGGRRVRSGLRPTEQTLKSHLNCFSIRRPAVSATVHAGRLDLTRNISAEIVASRRCSQFPLRPSPYSQCEYAAFSSLGVSDESLRSPRPPIGCLPCQHTLAQLRSEVVVIKEDLEARIHMHYMLLASLGPRLSNRTRQWQRAAQDNQRPRLCNRHSRSHGIRPALGR